jgi:hypothetical protein
VLALLSLLVFQSSSAVAWRGSFDIPALCADAGTQGAYELGFVGGDPDGFPLQAILTGSSSEVTSAVTAYCAKSGRSECSQFAPWLLLASPRLEVREAAHAWQLRLATQFLAGYDPRSIREALASAANQSRTYSPAATSSVHASLTNARAFADFRGKFKLISTLAPELCLPFGGGRDCASTLREALLLGAVGRLESTALVTMMDSVERVFSDPAHRRALSQVAITLLDRLDSADLGGNFLDDLLAAYRTVDATRAEDLAFDYLAFYGTRGASVDYVRELANGENYPVLLASYVISSALGVLDARTLSSGHPYSYPVALQTSCSYGAPYHFWLAAALARQLVLLGHSPRSAFLAAHLTGVGYEVFADTTTRTAWLPLTYDSDDYSDDAIRTNIVFDDAGARFGAMAGAMRSAGELDVDARLTLLYRKARFDRGLSEKTAESLHRFALPLFLARWWSVFAPDAGMKPWIP